jgi:hypothetical protein
MASNEGWEQEQYRRAFGQAAGSGPGDVTFPRLRVSVRGGQVYRWPFSKLLGSLRGAQAQMGSASTKHSLGAAAGAAVSPLTLPLAPIFAMQKKVVTAVHIVFADGTVHSFTVRADQREVSAIEADVLRFNALVG